MNIDVTMFHQAFFDEAEDLLSDLEGHLLRLEETPEEQELLHTIFRCAHSIKGGSATFGFTEIAQFTHVLETLLDKVRNGQVPVTRSLTQVLFESLDQMKALLAAARGEVASAPDSKELMARIEAAMTGNDGGAAPNAAPQAQSEGDSLSDPNGQWGVWSVARRYQLRFVPGPDTLRQGNDPIRLLHQLAQAGEILSLTCDSTKLPSLAELDPEASYLGWEIEFRTDWEEKQILEIFEFVADESEITLQAIAETPSEVAAAEPAPESAARSEVAPAPPSAAAPAAAAPAARAVVKSAEGGSGGAPAETHTLRVSAEKVDKLINLVGELVINQSMLNEVVQDFSMGKLAHLLEAVAQMERASRELQERVMAVRMLPIKHAFGRFPRLVRDLAAKCNKQIELNTSGEETELDKTVIEAIGDPLTHLIRNSVDHGLETPEERRAAGKPETGTVHLHAFQEGGNIIIEISDDGRGLDRERILRKAIERGLVTEDAALTDDAIYNLIFQPGFSTAAQVSDLSGRGVGMDIVKKGILALGGSVSLTTTPGQGTSFRIRLPLTMAILEGQSLSVGDEVYIIPLTSIIESLRPKAEDVMLVAGMMEVVQVRGSVLPIVRLYEVFGAQPYITDPTRGLLVIVENEERKAALLVDDLIGQNQVVIKSLEANYRKVEGLAGATILGDGRVALILDVPALVRGAYASRMEYAAA